MNDCEFNDDEMFELLERVMMAPDFDRSKADVAFDKLPRKSALS